MPKNSNYKPSEKQMKCKYSWPYMGENWDQTYCRKKMELTGKEEESFATNEDCENCPHYNSRFINNCAEYPSPLRWWNECHFLRAVSPLFCSLI